MTTKITKSELSNMIKAEVKKVLAAEDNTTENAVAEFLENEFFFLGKLKVGKNSLGEIKIEGQISWSDIRDESGLPEVLKITNKIQAKKFIERWVLDELEEEFKDENFSVNFQIVDTYFK